MQNPIFSGVTMSVNKEQQKTQPNDCHGKGADNAPANSDHSECCNTLTICDNLKNNNNEDDSIDDVHKGQQRLTSTNSKKQGSLKLEKQLEEWNSSDRSCAAENSSDVDVNWLCVIIDLDGYDVEANLRYVHRDSADPPISVEPFSRPYHKRRHSFVGSEEVF